MQTVRYALHNAARVFHRKNILVVFVVLFLIPFLNIGVASGYVGSIAVPEFIMDFIKGNAHLFLLFSGVLIGLGGEVGLAVSLFVLSAFGTPVSYACISILFYGHKEDRQEKIIHGEAGRHQEKKFMCGQ